MGHCVRLIVPTGNEAQLAPIIGRIVGRFGGVTVLIGRGYWSDPDDHIIKGFPITRDKVTVLETSVPGPWHGPVRQWWIDLARVVRDEWEQESVYLSVRDEFVLFVGPGAEVRGIERIGNET